MNRRQLIVAFTLATAALSARGAPPDDYAYAWPLHTDGDSAAWQIALTPEVYAAVTRADLGDVEVIDATRTPVATAPHRLPAPSTSEEAARPLTLFSLPVRDATRNGDPAISLHVQRDGDGTLRSIDARVGAPREAKIDAARERVLLADASAVKAPLATLIVEWDHGDDNVTAQFALDASDDLQSWRVVATNAVVMRLVQDQQVLERHDVALGGIRAAYLRLRRLDDGPPLRGLRVSARPTARATPVRNALEWIAATDDGSEPAANGRGVVYRYRLPAPLPLEALRIRLVDDNSLATIVPYRTAPAGPRLALGRTVAFRLRQGDTILENDDFAFAPGERIGTLSLETSVPLAHPPALGVAYRPDRLVFLAQSGGPFRLVAGSGSRVRATVPMANALGPLRARFGDDWQPPLATLGPRETLGGESARQATASPSHDWRTWVLWAVLAGAALLIAGMALKLVRSPPPG